MLGRLIAPISVKEFWADYWERRPLHVERSRPGWCADLPGVAEIDELIGHAGAKDVQFVRTARGIATEAEVVRTDGRADLAAAYRAYDDGWTIVISAVHSTSRRIGQLAADLEEAVAHRVSVNLYFTPPRAQGFVPHADGHDVFVLQVAGRKHWRVFAPSVPFPLEEQAGPVNRGRLGRRLIDAILEPGHVLYMPRGFIHDAVAGDEASVHLTLGVQPLLWMDLVHEVVAVAAERHEMLRHSVPLRERSPAPRVTELKERLRTVLSAIKDPSVLREASRRLRRRRVLGSTPSLDGHFAAIDSARSITLRTVVERRHGVNGAVQIEEGRAVLEFGGHRVDGPTTIEPALRFVAGTNRFAVAELPDTLTNGAKLELVRRLVLEGWLTVDRSATSRRVSR